MPVPVSGHGNNCRGSKPTGVVMVPMSKSLVITAVLLGAAALPAAAGSLAASSAAGGSSASSASSTSLETSSDSSSRSTGVAEGPYRIIEVATVAERPGTVRLRLQALAAPRADGGLVLHVPQQAFDRSRLGVGDAVAARQRPYGVEFARLDTNRAFFLLLDDEWARELPSHPVVL
jgi:hypothetical protein